MTDTHFVEKSHAVDRNGDDLAPRVAHSDDRRALVDQGQHAAAVKVLQRALKVPSDVEDELIGIYYYLGRAYEALEDTDHAIEYYDRVFALDINFADVTDRLRELR